MTSTTTGTGTGRSGSTSPSGARPGRMRPYSRALPISLLRAREALMVRFRPLLHARGITEQQWRIIRVLVDVGEAEMLKLSDLCVIHPASLSRILPRMEDAGLLVRRTNSADKRRVIVSLAGRGRALFEEIAPESEAVYAGIEDEVGSERLGEFYRMIETMIEAFGARPGDRPA